jgi:hypothetical protein
MVPLSASALDCEETSRYNHSALLARGAAEGSDSGPVGGDEREVECGRYESKDTRRMIRMVLLMFTDK